MNDIESKLFQLKEKLESLAFLVSRGGSEQEAHTKIVQSLVIVSELKNDFTPDKINENVEEINKVNRKLKLWAKRPHQKNSKILNAYLNLKRSGTIEITEKALKEATPKDSAFESNFAQMKIISKKNHGKIFEQYGEKVEIWKPVLSHVNEYEKMVFGGV